MIVKWRGEARRACIARGLQDLHRRGGSGCIAAGPTDGDHWEVKFTNLDADTRYFYSVGGWSDPDQQVHTAPVTGSAKASGPTRLLILGDSGTASERDPRTGVASHPGEAAAVYAGYKAYVAKSNAGSLDMVLLLGDNAYREGSDAQWQEALFGVYSELLKQVSIWPTIGNHEMGAVPFDVCPYAALKECEHGPHMVPLGGLSVTSDPGTFDGDRDGRPDEAGMAYLNIFTLPTRAEAGGVPSGTEQYYSFDFGNLHVVSLDSQLSLREPAQRASMKQWLIEDLRRNDLDWTVVIFHHPPYSKGANHDSDTAEQRPIDQPQIDLRREFTPIFEAQGVDVVFSGHSHSYERSYYLRGHTGESDSYSHAQYAELIDADTKKPALGRGGSVYSQLSPTSGGVDDRVVYVVAGSSGKGSKNSGLTDAAVWLRHPAHVSQVNDLQGRNGLPVTGSVVVDVSVAELVVRFIDANGAVLDHFTIAR